MAEWSGRLAAGDRRFALVVARTNELVTRQLLEGARDCLVRHGAASDALDVYWVAGAWELPPVVARLADAGRHAAIIALGAIIRGATPHFDYLCAATTARLAEIGARTGVHVALGVVTTDTLEQALERAGSKAGNYGWQAAMAAMETTDLLNQLDEESD